LTAERAAPPPKTAAQTWATSKSMMMIFHFKGK
jgi:hypothetical protein